MDLLAKVGYKIIDEKSDWSSIVQPNGKYMFTRSGSTLVTFKMPEVFSASDLHFKVLGGHTDSPVLKLRPNSKVGPNFNVHQLAVSTYGGGLWNTWLDRDLTIAGRVYYQENEQVKTKLIHIDRSILSLPNLCIHLRKGDERDYIKLNTEAHLRPFYTLSKEDNKYTEEYLNRHWKDLLNLICAEVGCEVKHFLNFDLNLVDAIHPSLSGINNEFIHSARLDNQSTCYAIVKSLTETADYIDKEGGVCISFLFDNEEIGSETTQGANSHIQRSTFERIITSMKLKDEELFEKSIRKSFVISCDASHGVHPNYPEYSETVGHGPLLGKGLVLKTNANMRYSTDSISTVMFRDICNQQDAKSETETDKDKDKDKIRYQEFLVKNSTPCGSTIGPMTSGLLNVRSVDIGGPLLAMHSIRELMCVEDIEDSVRFFNKFVQKYNWKKYDVDN